MAEGIVVDEEDVELLREDLRRDVPGKRVKTDIQ